jgi:hypothetical protein
MAVLSRKFPEGIEESHKILVIISGRRARIRIQDLQKAKPECYPINNRHSVSAIAISIIFVTRRVCTSRVPYLPASTVSPITITSAYVKRDSYPTLHSLPRHCHILAQKLLVILFLHHLEISIYFKALYNP